MRKIEPDAPRLLAEDGKPGCPRIVWDGPYSHRCSLGASVGRCAYHGPFAPVVPSTEGEPVSNEKDRRGHLLTTDLHTYAVPVSPKTLLETLCVAEFALNELERGRPGYNAGGTIDSHLERVRALMAECQRKRPTGQDGTHGDLHTDECGCTPERTR